MATGTARASAILRDARKSALLRMRVAECWMAAEVAVQICGAARQKYTAAWPAGGLHVDAYTENCGHRLRSFDAQRQFCCRAGMAHEADHLGGTRCGRRHDRSGPPAAGAESRGASRPVRDRR